MSELYDDFNLNNLSRGGRFRYFRCQEKQVWDDVHLTTARYTLLATVWPQKCDNTWKGHG